jgi:hypothetical protein
MIYIAFLATARSTILPTNTVSSACSHSAVRVTSSFTAAPRPATAALAAGVASPVARRTAKPRSGSTFSVSSVVLRDLRVRFLAFPH